MSLKVQITRLNDSAIPAAKTGLHQTYNTVLKGSFYQPRPSQRLIFFFRFLSPSNGFFNPFHNIGLPGGLCGPYVDPISSHSSSFILRDFFIFVFFPPVLLSSICLGKMLVILRDGRKLHGVLRSYDQFGNCQLKMKPFLSSFRNVDLFFLPANLVLEDTVERIYHENAFAENFHGLFLIRGENVVLLGEIVRPVQPACCSFGNII